VSHGAEILRVAEVERTLEMAYLDLLSRSDQTPATAEVESGKWGLA
jgi:hypothetical protein